jgi:hypothetical protein
MNSSKKLVSLITLLTLIAFPIVAIANAQAIEDWWKLRGYTAPTVVVKLADEDTMTDKSRRLFYLNHPQLISDKGQFNIVCPQSEQTIVLGCYYNIGNFLNEGIAIYDITDNRLSGVEEVTAAQRMQGLLASGKTQQYNASVAPYNARVVRLRSIISAYNAKVSQINSLVEQYNSLAYTQESLYNSLDTRVQTQTAQ